MMMKAMSIELIRGEKARCTGVVDFMTSIIVRLELSQMDIMSFLGFGPIIILSKIDPFIIVE